MKGKSPRAKRESNILHGGPAQPGGDSREGGRNEGFKGSSYALLILINPGGSVGRTYDCIIPSSIAKKSRAVITAVGILLSGVSPAFVSRDWGVSSPQGNEELEGPIRAKDDVAIITGGMQFEAFEWLR